MKRERERERKRGERGGERKSAMREKEKISNNFQMLFRDKNSLSV